MIFQLAVRSLAKAQRIAIHRDRIKTAHRLSAGQGLAVQISECLRVCQRVLAWDVRPQRQRVIGDKHLAAQLAYMQADTQRADAIQRRNKCS